MTTIFYVEDDPDLAFLTKDQLELRGYRVLHFADGQSASDAIAEESFNLCLLDIMLPKKSGYDLAREIRAKDKNIPILFLSAKSTEDDKLTGFEVGGDDYVTKPFSIDELVYRIQVFERRSQRVESQEQYSIGRLSFDPSQLKLSSPDKSFNMTQREADLLEYILKRKDQVIRRSEVLIALWGKDDYFLGRSLDVFISRLRKYLKEDDQLELANVHGVGWKFKHHGSSN